MRRRQWLFVALPLVLLTVAVVSIRMFGGSTGVANAQEPQLAIDMVQDTGWCNTIDSTASHVQNAGDYQVAICLLNGTLSSSDFNIFVKYDSTLNSCTSGDQTGKGLDANPNFIVSPVAGYDCSHAGTSYPSCGGGTAYISCGTLDNSVALTGPWAIALVTFHVIAGGTDTLSFGIAALYDSDGNNLLRCPATDVPDDDCLTATDNKTGGAVEPTATSTSPPAATSTPSCGLPGQAACPTSTPTARAFTKTPSPGPTNTPGAGEPTVPPPPPPPPPPSGGQQPSVTPPSTGTGSGGVTWATTLMWIMGSGTALSLLAGGFYLRRVNNR